MWGPCFDRSLKCLPDLWLRMRHWRPQGASVNSMLSVALEFILSIWVHENNRRLCDLWAHEHHWCGESGV